MRQLSLLSERDEEPLPQGPAAAFSPRLASRGAPDRPVPQPLASRMRPRSLEEVVGQEHLVGPGKVLRSMIEEDRVPSMILWGPPGVGKTTLAGVVANVTKAAFVNFSAVTSGIKEIKAIMARAEEARLSGERTVLFVDEIHRFNKAQQDAFLPFVEQGSIVLIGATTENPSFEINSALLSRCKVFVLHELGEDDLVKLLKRALSDERGFGGRPVDVPDDVLRRIAAFSDGDARKALGTLETCVANAGSGPDGVPTVTEEVLAECTSRKALLYDKDGEEHYNVISALHKSMRNSDPDAALYWLARMLEAGEDPLYVARRCIRFASEDVGLADPNALLLANAVWDTCNKIGMPECNCALAQIVTYLSLAPKSNAIDAAYLSAARDARERMAEPVPLQIRNAPTRLMKDLDYGKGYQFAHDTEEKITRMSCLPPSLARRRYYRPAGLGAEARWKERLAAVRDWREGRTETPPFSSPAYGGPAAPKP
ncbi:MAG: replication-associated recombination protein A [Kiritimatiellae bacterium]|nr:replication-associated recombination protein A [Kiritimatiellia bacterium]